MLIAAINNMHRGLLGYNYSSCSCCCFWREGLKCQEHGSPSANQWETGSNQGLHAVGYNFMETILNNKTASTQQSKPFL